MENILSYLESWTAMRATARQYKILHDERFNTHLAIKFDIDGPVKRIQRGLLDIPRVGPSTSQDEPDYRVIDIVGCLSPGAGWTEHLSDHFFPKNKFLSPGKVVRFAPRAADCPRLLIDSMFPVHTGSAVVLFPVEDRSEIPRLVFGMAREIIYNVQIINGAPTPIHLPWQSVNRWSVQSIIIVIHPERQPLQPLELYDHLQRVESDWEELLETIFKAYYFVGNALRLTIVNWPRNTGKTTKNLTPTLLKRYLRHDVARLFRSDVQWQAIRVAKAWVDATPFISMEQYRASLHSGRFELYTNPSVSEYAAALTAGVPRSTATARGTSTADAVGIAETVK